MSEPVVVEVVGELDLSTVAHWEATVGRAARSAELTSPARTVSCAV